MSLCKFNLQIFIIEFPGLFINITELLSIIYILKVSVF